MENQKNELVALDDKYSLSIIGSEDNAKGAIEILSTTLKSYSNRDKNRPLKEWVENEFRKYPNEFKTEEDIKSSANEVIISVEVLNSNRQELQEHLDSGKTKESWIAKKIEQGAIASNITNIGNYADGIDKALKDANEQSIRVLTNKNGDVNLNPQLHGFVAENHHVNSFNIDSASQNSPYRAEILESTKKNSVDIVIKDTNTGKIVKRYQSKYGYDSKATDSYFKDGNDNYKYKGQGKLVPQGQEGDISSATDKIEIDNIKSKPLSYEEAKQIQKEIQEQKYIKEQDWDKVDKTKIAKEIVIESGKMVIMHSLIQAGRVLAKRAWNAITGKKNQEANQDIKEWLESSWLGAKAIGLQTAVTTGLSIVVKKGFIKTLAKNTPIGTIANIAYVGIENAKIMYKLAKGEISFKEAMKQMHTTTTSTIGGLVGAGKGAVAGASILSIFGPIGTVVGGFVGATIGAIAGSSAGEFIAKGVQTVVSGVSKLVSSAKSIASSVSNAVSSGWNKAKALFSN